MGQKGENSGNNNGVREGEWLKEVRGRVTVSLISGLQAMFSYTAVSVCVFPSNC